MLLDDIEEGKMNTVRPDSNPVDLPHLNRKFNEGDEVRRKDSKKGPSGTVLGYEGLVVKVRWNSTKGISAELVGNLEKVGEEHGC